MTTYEDKRGLRIAHKTEDGAILLDDETAQAYAVGDYPLLRLTITSFDTELALYRITGQSGAILPKDTAQREQYRKLARAAINA